MRITLENISQRFITHDRNFDKSALLSLQPALLPKNKLNLQDHFLGMGVQRAEARGHFPHGFWAHFAKFTYHPSS